jgi:hypothetical protein
LSVLWEISTMRNSRGSLKYLSSRSNITSHKN